MTREVKKDGGRNQYTPEFLEMERRKRYGYANKIDESKDAYTIKMFFPTIVPPGKLRDKFSLPETMPDYDYDISLEDTTLTVKARLEDKDILKLTGIVNSFPDRFFKDFILDKPVNRFESEYNNKILSITVYKEAESG